MFLGPWSEMHRLNLGWFIAEWNKFYAEWQSTLQAITGALTGEIERVEAAMTDLYAARDAAAASASSANSSALNASASSLAAMDARDAAVSAKNTAQSAASSATASETAAGNSATLASNKATQASNSATAAAQSAGAAQQSETDAATEALKSEGHAVGKQNGTDVTEGSPYYHNNSKYYAESIAGDAAAAAQSASAAAGSASAAAQSAADAAGSAAGLNNAAILYKYIDDLLPNTLTPNSSCVKVEYDGNNNASISGFIAGTYLELTRPGGKTGNFGIAYSESAALIESAGLPSTFSLKFAPGSYTLITKIIEYDTHNDEITSDPFTLRFTRKRNGQTSFISNRGVTRAETIQTNFTVEEGDEYVFYFVTIHTAAATQPRTVRAQMYVVERGAALQTAMLTNNDGRENEPEEQPAEDGMR